MGLYSRTSYTAHTKLVKKCLYDLKATMPKTSDYSRKFSEKSKVGNMVGFDRIYPEFLFNSREETV